MAAIRLETLAEWRHRASSAEEKQQVETGWSDESEQLVQKMQLRSGSEAPFSRQFLDDEKLHDIYWLGHHNDRSFGATPYLLRSSTSEGTEIWIMVDSPKFSSSAVKDVEGLTGPGGPDYLFLSHVDDTADHNKWAQYWQENGHGNLKRILHSAELRNNWVGDTTLEEVEILLEERESTDGSTAYKLSGEVLPSNWQESTSEPVVVLHTPGHSQGSITLYRRPSNSEPGILFTGDTYGWTPRGGGKMIGMVMISEPKLGACNISNNWTGKSLLRVMATHEIIVRLLTQALMLRRYERSKKRSFKLPWETWSQNGIDEITPCCTFTNRHEKQRLKEHVVTPHIR